jgi:hypothetical protein
LHGLPDSTHRTWQDNQATEPLHCIVVPEIPHEGLYDIISLQACSAGCPREGLGSTSALGLLRSHLPVIVSMHSTEEPRGSAIPLLLRLQNAYGVFVMGTAYEKLARVKMLELLGCISATASANQGLSSKAVVTLHRKADRHCASFELLLMASHLSRLLGGDSHTLALVLSGCCSGAAVPDLQIQSNTFAQVSFSPGRVNSTFADNGHRVSSCLLARDLMLPVSHIVF